MARHESGWVRLHRKIEESDIAHNFLLMGLWATLLRWANWRETKVTWRGLPRELERGEVLTSVTELSNYGSADRKTITKWLNYLRVRGSIDIESSPRGSQLGVIIKIKNYEQYQGLDAERSHELTPDDTPEPGHEGPMSMDTYKESNKGTKKQKNKYAGEFERLNEKYKTKFKGTTTGPAKDRFFAQIKTDQDLFDLETSMDHYARVLEANGWRQPKQTFATYLGTKKSGLFWRDYIVMPELAADKASDTSWINEGFEKAGS